MKKIISASLAALLTSVLCISGAAAVHAEEASAPKIVTTIFPEYDWVRALLGENPAGAEVTMLLDNGVDLHSYQPTAEDMMKIAESDLFIYVGGESDSWVEDALAEVVNKDIIVINLLEQLGSLAREEEVVEGMQEEAHDHDHEGEEVHEDEDHHEGEEAHEDEDHHEGELAHEDKDHHEGEEAHEDEDHHEGEEAHEHGDEPELDEHVWLSLKNTKVLCTVIEQALEQVDPKHAEAYQANLEAYTAQLDELDSAYQEAVSAAAGDTLLFGDRFPFRYLTDDYGLSYYAAFMGCSAETEASFDTIIFLATKMDELELPVIMTLEGSDHRIAETILQTSTAKNQTILEMDSMQSVTAKDVEAGATYLQIMEKNLEVLKEALGS